MACTLPQENRSFSNDSSSSAALYCQNVALKEGLLRYVQFVYEVIAQVLSDMLVPRFPGACGRDGRRRGEVAH